MNGIADAGFLVAFSSRRDQYHPWALALSGQASGPFLTCEAVLAEVSFHLRSSRPILEMLETGFIRVAFNLTANRESIALLAERYADRCPDLADLCLVRMSELYPQHPVITIDGDFRVYRRFRREAIPLLMPPDL